MQGRSASSGGNVVRAVALLLGIGYLAAGLIGFVATGFTGPVVTDTNDQFLGFFDLNIFHNIVHIAIGLGLIIASRMSDVTITQGVLIGVGLFYVLAALLGFLDYLQIISINRSLSVDNFFHLATGLVAVIFGLIGVRQQEEEPVRAGRGTAAQRPRSLEERRALWDEEETYREKTY